MSSLVKEQLQGMGDARLAKFKLRRVRKVFDNGTPYLAFEMISPNDPQALALEREEKRARRRARQLGAQFERMREAENGATRKRQPEFLPWVEKQGRAGR